jgi:hypothetical protein
MRPSGQSSVIGVVDGILIQSESLFKEVSEAWHKIEAEVLETMLVLARLVQ